MPDLSIARPAWWPAWWPAWSEAAARRTLRAVLVVPPLFALTYEGFGNLQIALFAAFGGFASLIVASFGGSRRDKLVAHLGLAVTGSIALIIGTAVSAIEWLAVLVTIPVASIVDAWARRELPPRRVRVPLRCRGNIQGLQDPADGGCADPVTELEQLALDPLVSPAGDTVGSTASWPAWE